MEIQVYRVSIYVIGIKLDCKCVYAVFMHVLVYIYAECNGPDGVKSAEKYRKIPGKYGF